MKYAAFISYRHGGIDEKVAKQVFRLLERYRVPRKIAKKIGTNRIGRVFRDSEELKAGSDLSALIREALDETEWLIIICTKRFKDSVWCMEEVEHFLEIRGRERIITILVEGEPAESFPKVLTEVERDGKIITIEPLAVDIRDDSEKKILKNVKREQYRFLADMLDVDYDDLYQRERERILRRSIGVAGIVIFGISAFAAVMVRNNLQLESAYTALDNSNQQTLRGESYYLAEYAGEAYQNGDRKTAVKLSLEALPNNLANPDRPFVSSAMRALTQAMGTYDVSTGYQREQLFEEEKEAYDTKVQISKDQKIIVIEKYRSASNNTLDGEVTLYSMEDAREICSYSLGNINRSFYANSMQGAVLLSDSRTLIYAGEDNTVSVDIYTGKENFRGNALSDLTVSKKEDLVVGVDYNKSILYAYKMDGTLQLECELGDDIDYTLGDINPDSTMIVLAASTTKLSGLLLLDASTGENFFINQDGTCQDVTFTAKNRLCFIRIDREASLKHIVEYNLNKGKENYLCDATWNLQSMSISANETCIYYRGTHLYEVEQVTGNGKWKRNFPSDIISVMCGGNTIGVSLKNGSIYFFDLYSKKLINSQAGNGEPFYFTSLDDNYASLRDYWGRMVRIYHHDEQKGKELQKNELFTKTEDIPDRWYTCSPGSRNFIIGTQKGGTRKLWIMDSGTMEVKQSTTLADLGYQTFDNLTIDMADNNYFSIRDYATYINRHYDVFPLRATLEYDDDAYYLYNENHEKFFLTKGKEIILYDAKSGAEQKRYSIPEKYNRGVVIGDTEVYSSDKEICISDKAKKEEKIIENAELYSFHEGREMIFYRDPEGKEWFVYSLKEGKVVCQGKTNSYASTMFFGEDRYFLNDYSEVYDMENWKKVLDLSGISNGVYGVSTTEKLPYFVVWYQDSDAKSTGRASGSNVAYLYDKHNPDEIIGEIPNYVTTTKDGEVVVYDGAKCLYKIPLYSSEEILKMAEAYVGDMKFSDYQREKYHLYSE